MEKSFTGILEDSNSNLWGNHIKVPEDVVAYFKEKKVKRLLCTLDKIETIHCAIMGSAEGPYILINKELKKKLIKDLGHKIQVKLKPDNSKYGMPMSEELEQCLAEDKTVLNYFENLTTGKQRNLIHMVNKIKNPDIKIRRALSIVEHLNREQGELDFKKLNEVIKEFNQRFKTL